MDSNYLVTFREVAKWQSFTRAAEILGYAQSSVTAQIQKLEAEFGVELFERWGRSVRLTTSGEQLLEYANHVIALLEEAKGSLTDESQMSGSLVLGTSESLAAYFLPPYMREFRRMCPKTRLMLQSSACCTHIQSVFEGRIDFALLIDRKQVHPDLVCLTLREEEMVMIASPRHPLIGQERVTASDLAGESFIVTEERCGYREIMINVLQAEGVFPEISYEFTSLEAIKQCAAYDLGIAFLPKITVEEELNRGELAALSFRHPDIRIYTQLVYREKKWVSPPMARFLELIESGTAEGR